MAEKDVQVLNEILARINGEEPTTPGGGKPSEKSEGTVAMQKGSLQYQSNNAQAKTNAFVAETVALSKAGINVHFLDENESYIMDEYDTAILTPYIYGVLNDKVINEVNRVTKETGEFPDFVILETDKYTYLCSVDNDYNLTIKNRYDRTTGLLDRANKPFVDDGGIEKDNQHDKRGNDYTQSENQRSNRGNDSVSKVGEQSERDGSANKSVPNSREVRIGAYESLPLKNPKGNKIYGWTVGGEAFLTPDGINSETPVHEYTHLWSIAMQRRNPDAWSSVVSLLKGSKCWRDVVKDGKYANLKTDDQIASEVLSRLSGANGAKILEEEARNEQDGGTDSEKSQSILSRVKSALEKFWNWVGRDLFKIKRFNSIEEIKDRVLYDFVSGTDLGDVTTKEVNFHKESSRDEEYAKAVESGDEKKQNKLVKAAAKAAMPETKVVDENGMPRRMFHGSDIPKDDESTATKSVDIFYCPVEIDGTLYSARMVVKNLKEGAHQLDEFILYNVNAKKEKTQTNGGANSNNRGVKPSPTESFNGCKVKEIIHSNQTNDLKILGITQGTTKFKLDKDAPVFLSNAAEAVKDIKQEKAPAGQWLAMLEKAGGLKAGEDKWLGLRAWLGEQGVDALAGKRDKNITKAEILDYIAKNDIRIEEVKYGVLTDETQFPDKKKIEEFAKPFVDEYESLIKQGVHRFDAFEQMRKKYGDLDFLEAFEDSEDGNTIYLAEDENGFYTQGAMKFVTKRIGYNPIDGTRLDYTTEGLENKKEIALTVPTIEPYNENDDVHFGDAGGGRAVAWVRFGDATSANADGTVAKVLVIDEVQSKRHQDGREKGYVDEELEKRYAEALDKRLAVLKHIISKYDLDGGSFDEEILSNPNVSETDKAGLRMAKEEFDNVRAEYKQKGNGVVPDAPFDKNWHELAMKRMLRYAAENGYDKVAWTTGKQQSKRYNIGGIVESIESGISVDGERMTDINMTDGTTTTIYHDDEGNVLKILGQNLFEGAKNISEVVGKETADKILSQTERGTSGIKSYNADNLEIGGNGMKGFYDQMLPSFMNKYGKKWGVKVGEVELDLPNDGDRKMWSVDVNDAMKADVMRGQKKFKAETPKTEAEAEEANVRFKLVDDPVKIAELSKEKKVVVYRAMQKVDDKYYPPMAAVVDGEMKPIQMMAYEQSDERPDLAVHARYAKGPKKGQLKYDENGEPVYVFSLKKGTKGDDGKKLVDIDARYNPYIHTSRSMINDQFSSAWNRGNLVTVAVEVPESELNSGYRAEKAYLTAGEHEWKSGPISRKLADLGNPRKVILSRYDRPIREVPYEEVAKFYAEQLKGTDIEVPFNTVNESLREALVKEGVKIGAPENSNAGKAAIPAYEEWLKNGGNNGPGGGKIENLTKAQKKERENRRRELVYANYEADSQKMIESGVLLNIQGNPIDKDGRFIVTKLYSALDITKDDFERPIRNIELPSLDDEVDKKVGGNGRNVIIKRSVFLKNNLSHPEIEISDNGQILDNALYRPNELINDKPNSKPNYWIVTKLSNKPVVANIDVDANKSHIELVGWRFISADDIARIERRAIKEGGQVLITNIGAADLSALQDGSERKGTTSSATDQTNGGEILPGEKSPGTGADKEYNSAVASGDVEKQNELVKAAAKERDERGNKTEDSALLGNEDQITFSDVISRTKINDTFSSNGETIEGLESILKRESQSNGLHQSKERIHRISAITQEIRERKRRAAEIRQELGAKPNEEVQQREVERYFHKLRGKQIKTHFTDILKNISGQAECSQLLGLKQ